MLATPISAMNTATASRPETISSSMSMTWLNICFSMTPPPTAYSSTSSVEARSVASVRSCAPLSESSTLSHSLAGVSAGALPCETPSTLEAVSQVMTESIMLASLTSSFSSPFVPPSPTAFMVLPSQ